MINNEDIGNWESYIFLDENWKNWSNEISQIPLSLTTVLPYKIEWKIWMIVSLYSDDRKWDSMNK